MSSKFLDKTGLDTLWAKIKSTFQTLGNLVTTSTGWGSTPSDTKYPSEKLVKTSLDAKATDSAVLHKAGLETVSGQKWFEGGFCVFNKSNVGYGHYTLPETGKGADYNNWPEEYKDGAHFREWRLSFNTGINFWGKLRITIVTSYSSFNASGSIQKTINCAFNTVNVFNNTGYYNDLGINSEKEFRISDLIWNNTTACWEIKIHSIKPTSNNTVPVLLIEFWTYSTTNRDSALGIHWVSTTPDIVTDTTYYTKRYGNASTTPGTGGVQFNWADTPVQQSPYGDEIFNRSHTIPVGNGGTGKTTAKAAQNTLLGGMNSVSSDAPADASLVFKYASPTDADGAVFTRPLSKIWTWIKNQISSVLGLTETSYGGNAATATTAAGYTSGGAIDTALKGKQDGLGISSSGDSGKFLNQKGQWAAPSGTEQVNADWDATSGKAEILHKPQNLVQDASYVHTDNNYTTTDKNKVASAVQPGNLGTAAYKNVPTSGDASTTQVVLGSDSRLTRSVWSGGSTAVCGYKICTTSQIVGRSGQTSNIYAIVMGSMCLTNKYAAQPHGSDSSGVNGALAMGSFMIWCEGKPDGTLTARARLFSSDAALNNADIALCKKYVNGAVEWFVAFGPWTSPNAVTTSRAFGMSVCFDYVQNVNIPDTLEAVPSGYGYEDYYLLWKHPYLQATEQGAGSKTIPVYVTANGEVKKCKKLVQAVTNIDTSTMDPDVLYVM